MKIAAFISTFIVILFTCKNDDSINTSAKIIENKTFNTTLLIDGHGFDGYVIKNCVFENINGDALQIRDVKHLTIQDCVFRHISEDAIRFRNSGSSDGVKILNNRIYDIKENGILAPENHINTLIKGNLIYNVATSNVSSRFGAPHHGIYFQGFNVTITENTIYNIKNNGGNCISIRTYGNISRNKLYQATDHGISYFSDHPGNSELLLIENNVIYDNGKRGIHLAGNGNTLNHIGRALIRFNTIVSNTNAPIGINNKLTGVTFQLIGNIGVRTDGKSNYIYSDLSYTANNNITNSSDVGFVDFMNRDLRITTSSTAVNAATGVNDFPKLDFEGNPRNASNLDAGAFEI